jgi:putative NIF3 family GTP cyclohydrolase 1 type 2
VKLDDLVAGLDAYFRIAGVRGEFPFYEHLPGGAPYWREFAEPAYLERFDGLMVRGGDDVRAAVTCVFPSDHIVESLEPGTLLFAEHPIDLEDEPGFLPLARSSFERMRELGISFYHAHGPLDQHPEISPSRLIADALDLTATDEYYPIVEGIPGGAAVIGDCALSLDELQARLASFLGVEVPVEIVSRPRDHAGRVAVAAGGGADADILRKSLERGCETYVTGNAVTRCRLDFVRAAVDEFLALAEQRGVAVVDGTHYGTEKPPQLAMVQWFEARGLPARFAPDGPK